VVAKTIFQIFFCMELFLEERCRRSASPLLRRHVDLWSTPLLGHRKAECSASSKETDTLHFRQYRHDLAAFELSRLIEHKRANFPWVPQQLGPGLARVSYFY